MIADPAELPDLRLRMREQVMTLECGHEVVRRLNAGKSAVTPRLVGPPEIRRASAVTGALLMARREARRLSEAQLYWVDRDMTALTLAAADRPHGEPVEPVTARRLPAEAGLMCSASRSMVKPVSRSWPCPGPTGHHSTLTR